MGLSFRRCRPRQGGEWLATVAGVILVVALLQLLGLRPLHCGFCVHSNVPRAGGAVFISPCVASNLGPSGAVRRTLLCCSEGRGAREG